MTADLSDAAAAVLEIVLILLAIAYFWSWTVSSEFPVKSRSLPARVSVIEAERSNPPVYHIYY